MRSLISKAKLLVSENYAGVVLLNETTNGIDPIGQSDYEPAHMLIDAESEAGFSALDVGYSNVAEKPMDEADEGEQLIILGTDDGDVFAWSYSPLASEVLEVESAVSLYNFAPGIRDVRLTDIDASGASSAYSLSADDLAANTVPQLQKTVKLTAGSADVVVEQVQIVGG